ncbi:hypothetical protein BKA63DRAFT_211258 [Paraphoma chrysanthemicola]|nr:hypothetical protein BKA63DRAFT_211258 [Paraphoma chrysanthemicola]
MSFGHYMLVQNGCFAPVRCEAFDTYFEVKQGSMLVLAAEQSMSDEEQSRFERDASAIKDVEFKSTTTLLRAGEDMVVPAHMLYNFEVTEHMLVVTGHVVPHGQLAGLDETAQLRDVRLWSHEEVDPELDLLNSITAPKLRESLK